MKKQYISPAINIHQLRVESMLASASPLRFKGTRFGNSEQQKSGYIPDHYEVSPFPDSWQYDIEAVEGDDWSTL